jgi:hypothetical protein
MVGLDDVASCYDLISMLEHQLRTARALLDELRERSSQVTQMSMVVDYCAELRAEATSGTASFRITAFRTPNRAWHWSPLANLQVKS